MATTSRQLDLVLTLKDDATKKLKSFKNSVSDIDDKISGLGEKMSIGFGAAAVGLGALGKVALDTSSDFEQARIAFDTLTGDAEKGGQLMEDIAKSAAETPFELPQLVTGAKQLLAYNIEAENLIPTLEMLGDITAGVGTEKMPQLILAYGQVRAATKLTGAELRQFTEAGVPMLDLLQKLAAQGKLTAQSQGGVAKTTKGSAKQIESLNAKLAIAKQRLKEVKKSGDANKSTIMRAKEAVRKYEEQLGSATTMVGGMGDMTNATAEDIRNMISDGTIKFEDVQNALKLTTSEGGKFFNLMKNQSSTFGGIVSNLKDKFSLLSLEIFGVSKAGEIMEGGLFDRIKGAAERFLNFLDSNWDEIIQTAINSINKIIGVMIIFKDSLISVKNFIEEHRMALENLAISIGIILIPALVRYITLMGVGTVASIGKSIMAMTNWILEGIRFVGQVVIMIAKLVILIAKLSVNFIIALAKGVATMAQWIGKAVLMTASLIKQIFQLGIAIAQYLIYNGVMLAGAVASGVLTAATWLLNVALLVLTSPITLVILAIGALIAIGVLLYKNWDVIKAKSVDVWESVKQTFINVWSSIASFFSGIWDGMKNIFKSSINWIVEGLNKVIRVANKIKIPEWAGGDGEALLNLPEIPMLAKGGIVNKPTMSMIGEGGEPEMVLPLSKAKQMGFGGGGGQTIVNNFTFKDSIVTSQRDLEDMIDKIMRKKINLAN